MSEAVARKLEAEDRPAQRLVQLLSVEAVGDDEAEEAQSLSLAMIDTTAKWIEADIPNAEVAAGKVRGWWLKQVRDLWDGEEAEEFEWRWEVAFAKARAGLRTTEDFGAKLDASIAKAPALRIPRLALTSGASPKVAEKRGQEPERPRTVGPEPEAEEVEAKATPEEPRKPAWRS